MTEPKEAFFKKPRMQKQKKDEIERIEKRIAESDFGYVEDKKFSRLPLSRFTLSGLKHANYYEMTEIQEATLSLSLANKDILGAAKTGSGKTLAFIIPLLEILYRKRWTRFDRLGALVISPTRELALQIFQALKKVGKFHDISAGLVIGGKNLKEEQALINRMNIMICTPGRLLQHMDQTAGFDCSNLQILVLDEADRILDMGFEKTMNAIIQNLPKERQTLLFSATQTKSVKDLARLSLKNPEYIAVHEKAEHSTPQQLQQFYIVCELHEKLDILYSFLRKHLQSKILIFVSSCKQVRYFYESFKKMRPGIPLMCLYGKQKQPKRLELFENFGRMKAAVLFCTDIASRGLDFPAVDWVIQLDCPENGETYIHRVGRTARYKSEGYSLLFLVPSEQEGMLEILQYKKVPIERTKINPHSTISVQKQLAAFCSQDPELKYLAQKALISYIRSVHLQADKKTFDVSKLSLEDYAASLGLPNAPKIKIIKKSRTQEKNISYQMRQLEEMQPQSEEDSCNADSEKEKTKPKTRVAKLFSKTNQNVLSEHYMKLHMHEEDNDDGDELLTLCRKDHDLDDLSEAVRFTYMLYEKPYIIIGAMS
jgi:ATP-dependent RNA helicase DDX10/DBP4